MMSKSIRMRFAVALLSVFVTGPAAFAQERAAATEKNRDSAVLEKEDSAPAKTEAPAKVKAPAANQGGLLGNKWFLSNRAYYEPLIAEPRAATVSVLFPARADGFQFSQKPGSRAVWDISLGKEIPILGYEVGVDQPDQALPKGAWGIGLWLPISFHVIEDFKDDSNPIINTDYRFAGLVKFQKAISDTLRLGARFQFGHESTHLGDEFSLAARRTRPDFERINVSYEYWEYGGSVEKDIGVNYMIFRHGGIGLWKPDKGYYSDKLLEPDSRTIARSKRNFEPIFGFQWIFSKDTFKWRPFASVDVRYKTIYDYNKPSSDTDEDKQFSWNALFGVKKKCKARYERGCPELYLRFYHGVNPNGQLRNQRDYKQIGFGVHFPI